MSNFIITDKDIKEAKRYYEQDRIKNVCLEELFKAMLYSFLSIGQLYKTQMMIYRLLINNNMDKPDTICKNTPLLKSIVCKARFPQSIFNFIFDFSTEWYDTHRHYFEYIIWDLKENGKKFSHEIRDNLVKTVNGCGYKVASLFLDICGYDDIGVIDIWSLRYLQSAGYDIFIRYNRKSGKNRGLNKRQYLRCEKYMEAEAKKYGFSLAFFQLLVWVKTSSWKRNHNPDQLLLFEENI